MNEPEVQAFWNSHPCGDHIVGGLHDRFAGDYERFFEEYDSWRYHTERHILRCLDLTDWHGKRVLEIGLGEGAESEQLIRRGARWSGVDLTAESVDRVRTRLTLRSLPYEALRQGSVLDIPWADDQFDIVFSHGVLHHVPDVRTAQAEIHRVLRPGGMLVAMLYAKRSLNYQVSIRVLRRAAVALAYPVRSSRLVEMHDLLRQHVANAEREGLTNYLAIDQFTHRNTDGPSNPYAKVYSLREVVEDFSAFELVDHSQRYLHAPPLPVAKLPLSGRLVGWHLWVWMKARENGVTP